MGFTFYKPGQAKYARGVTAIFIGIILLFGCWELYGAFSGGEEEEARPLLTVRGFEVTWDVAVVSVVFVAGLVMVAVLTYGLDSQVRGLKELGEKSRAFIDFLIDVEAELRKVAWPNRKDLLNSTWVVIVTMVVFAIFLVFMDRILQLAMRTIGVL